MESGCIRSCRLKESRDLPVLKPEGTVQCNELWNLDVSGAVAQRSPGFTCPQTRRYNTMQ